MFECLKVFELLLIMDV